MTHERNCLDTPVDEYKVIFATLGEDTAADAASSKDLHFSWSYQKKAL